MAKKIILSGLGLFTVLLLVGISVYFYKTLNNTEAKHRDISDLENLEVAKDLSEMIKASDIIAIGSYEGLHSTINLARNKSDVTKESTEVYHEAKVFRFNIEDYLKGNTEENTIKIIHSLSLPFSIGETLGYKDEEVEDVDPTYIKPEYHKKYMVFINKAELDDMYIKSMEPFLVKIGDSGTLELKSNVVEEFGFDDTITGGTLIELKEEIEQMK